MELPKNTNPPRAFDTDNPAEITRLYQETVGFLRTCKDRHHGTDFEGRNFAIAGFKDLLTQPVRADPAQSLADALEGIIKFDDDEGIFDCLEYQDMFKSADFRKLMESARSVIANYRKGE